MFPSSHGFLWVCICSIWATSLTRKLSPEKKSHQSGASDAVGIPSNYEKDSRNCAMRSDSSPAHHPWEIPPYETMLKYHNMIRVPRVVHKGTYGLIKGFERGLSVFQQILKDNDPYLSLVLKKTQCCNPWFMAQKTQLAYVCVCVCVWDWFFLRFIEWHVEAIGEVTPKRLIEAHWDPRISLPLWDWGNPWLTEAW